MTQFYKDKIEFADRESVVKLHLIMKCFQKGIHISDADLDSLVELYYTGYNTNFFTNCVSKGYYKSEQTVRNAITRMTSLGIISAKKRGNRVINSDFIPRLDADKLIFQYLIGNP